MSIGNLRSLLKAADEGKYAINAFNFTDVWDMLSIVAAAEEKRAPVILMAHPENFTEVSLKMCGVMAMQAAKDASVPVVLHLDHSNSVEECKAAIDYGFPSVMIDASKYPLEENIKRVLEVTTYAKKTGTCVEAEIGRIKGGGYEGGYNGDDFLAQVEDCVKLVDATGVDSLAVGIGTAHGFYVEKPEINFTRLLEINEAVSVPLVLHGGTGVPREDVQKGISLGLNKVNVGTCIAATYMNTMRKELIERGENAFTIDVVGPVKKAVKAVVGEWIDVCMSSGKA